VDVVFNYVWEIVVQNLGKYIIIGNKFGEIRMLEEIFRVLEGGFVSFLLGFL
jgi:hypothetical protein